MSELPLPPDESPIANATRGIRWDALAAIIASLVGLLALVVAGYTAYVQRQQVRAQVWPYVDIGQSTFPPSIYVVNQGVGPAIVRSVEVLVDGKPQPDWDHVFAAEGMQGDIATQGPAINGNVLAPGSMKAWVNFDFTRDQYQSFMDASRAAHAGNDQSKSAVPTSYELFAGRQRLLFNQFLDGAKRTRLQVRICYCSTLGDCKLATWAVGQHAQQTQGCNAVPRAGPFRN